MRSPRTRILLCAVLLGLVASLSLPTPGGAVAATDLVVSGPDGTLYLLYGGSRHQTDSPTLRALGVDERRTRVLTQPALEALPAGQPLPPFTNGSFVTTGDGSRYLLLDGVHQIPDDATFAAYGWAGGQGFPAVPVQPVDAALLAALPLAAPLAPATPGNDQARFDWGYCTWWVAARRVVPWNGDAIEWYANARTLGFAVGQAPVPGAILVRNSATWSAYGHVAYVESVRGTTFTVSEMNVNTVGELTTATYDLTTHPLPGLIGFVYWRYGAVPTAPPQSLPAYGRPTSK